MANTVRLVLPIITISLALMPNYFSPVNGSAERVLPPVARACTYRDLKIKAGEGNAAMGGVRETPFIFTNVSASTCTLEGYPGLELLNQKGAVIKRATKQKSDQPPGAVSIEPGKTAWFNLNYNAGGAGYMGKPCPTYTRIRISLVSITKPFILSDSIQTCAKTDFSVTAISAGSPE